MFNKCVKYNNGYMAVYSVYSSLQYIEQYGGVGFLRLDSLLLPFL